MISSQAATTAHALLDALHAQHVTKDTGDLRPVELAAERVRATWPTQNGVTVVPINSALAPLLYLSQWVVLFTEFSIEEVLAWVRESIERQRIDGPVELRGE